MGEYKRRPSLREMKQEMLNLLEKSKAVGLFKDDAERLEYLMRVFQVDQKHQWKRIYLDDPTHIISGKTLAEVEARSRQRRRVTGGVKAPVKLTAKEKEAQDRTVSGQQVLL